jgi:Site-specific DNA methylase
MEKKLGSLYDGIGGFPLAAKRNGIRPVWASEIEKLSHGSYHVPVPGDKTHGRHYKTAWGKPPECECEYRGFAMSGLIHCRETPQELRGCVPVSF